VGPGSPDGDLVIHSQTSIFPHSATERELIGKWAVVQLEPEASLWRYPDSSSKGGRHVKERRFLRCWYLKIPTHRNNSCPSMGRFSLPRR
jgi:hypothetical protein